MQVTFRWLSVLLKVVPATSLGMNINPIFFFRKSQVMPFIFGIIIHYAPFHSQKCFSFYNKLYDHSRMYCRILSKLPQNLHTHRYTCIHRLTHTQKHTHECSNLGYLLVNSNPVCVATIQII